MFYNFVLQCCYNKTTGANMKTLRKENEKQMMQELKELEELKKTFKKTTDRIAEIKNYFKTTYKNESVKTGDYYLLVKEVKKTPWRTNDLVAFLGDRINDYRDEKYEYHASFKNEAKEKAA